MSSESQVQGTEEQNMDDMLPGFDDSNLGDEEAYEKQFLENGTYEIPDSQKDKSGEPGEKSGDPESKIDPDPEKQGTDDPSKQGDPQGNSEEESYEKRYKNLQSHSDRTIAEKDKTISEKDQTIADLQAKYDELSQQIKNPGAPGKPADPGHSQRTPDNDPEPPLPTDEEWDDKPKEAYQKEKAHAEWKARQEDRAKRAEAVKQVQVKAALFQSKRDTVWKIAQDMYPDITDKNSELFKKATEILNTKLINMTDPFHPDANYECDLEAIKQADKELKSATPPQKDPPKPKEPDTSYIANVGSQGGGNVSGSAGSQPLSEDEYMKLSDDEKDAYDKKVMFQT